MNKEGVRRFKAKTGFQKYNSFYAFNIPNFKEAVRYFVRQMRRGNFVHAHHDLVDRYGVDLAAEVEIFCQLTSITVRPSCGRLFLADGYEKRLPRPVKT